MHRFQRDSGGTRELSVQESGLPQRDRLAYGGQSSVIAHAGVESRPVVYEQVS
jgi:hypothetical protein